MKQNEDSLLREKLKEYFGFSSFKGNQEAVIRNVLSGKDTFVLMPTGGGKSLCYQLPALLMDGVAIVISPLIALMKNQVDAMRTYSNDAGIAHFLNSSLNKSAIAQVRNDVLEGRTKLLYFAPESLTKEDNVAFLRKVKVSFYAIDEAHCISEWGHDFRPEYRRIRPIINEIGTAPLIALTATATPKVQMDIQKNLGMSDASVFKSSFNRPNLYYEIRPKHDVDREIIRYIKQHEGKSGIIYCLSRKLDLVADAPGEYTSIEGDLNAINHVEFVDQNPIGKSTRSNPATYLKAYDAIRTLFANQPLAKQMGFTAQYFSFNTEGGRCEECKGAGYVTIEMQFMADLTLTCEACKGKRFKHDILEVRYGGKDVNDVLNMTVNEAIEFFSNEKLQHNEEDFATCRIIVSRLKPLQEVGLGYIKLGQTSSTFSGGENQRVKLAYFIGKEEQSPTLFIFDEPTTGLHFHDIKRLLHAFDALIERGHSLVVIEHNLDVIKCADYIIDLGPEGGDKGGSLVVAGTPEEVVACPESLTGKFLQKYL